jgi:cytochrome b subunit of formate dehydrogenase
VIKIANTSKFKSYNTTQKLIFYGHVGITNGIISGIILQIVASAYNSGTGLIDNRNGRHYN